MTPPLVLDASRLDAYQACPRRYYYAYQVGRQPAEPKPALLFGQGMHRLLRYRMRFAKRYQRAVAERFINRFYALHGGPTDHRTPERALALLDLFDQLLPQLDWYIVQSNRGPVVELRFICELAPDIYWQGVIDLLVEHEQALWVVDYKTTSAFTEEPWALSQQLRGYAWAINRMLGEHVLGAVVVRFRVRAAPVDDSDIAVEYVPFPPASLDDWHQNTLHIADNLRREQVWPMHTLACRGRWGLCPYWLVCSASPDQRDAVLSSNLYVNAEIHP